MLKDPDVFVVNETKDFHSCCPNSQQRSSISAVAKDLISAVNSYGHTTITNKITIKIKYTILRIP